MYMRVCLYIYIYSYYVIMNIHICKNPEALHVRVTVAAAALPVRGGTLERSDSFDNRSRSHQKARPLPRTLSQYGFI